MQTPPTPDTSLLPTRYGWLSLLLAAIVTWLSKDSLSTLLGKWIGRKRVSEDAEEVRQRNIKSAGEWMQEMFNKLTLMELNTIKLNKKVEELKETCADSDELITHLTRSSQAKDQWIGMLEDRLREGKVELPRKPPTQQR